MAHDVESVDPLSATQEGILFHSLYAPDSGVYVAQLSCRFEGELDQQAFRRAWRRILERHAALRTAFVWEELEQPAQVVLSRVELPFVAEDWRRFSPAEQQERWRAVSRRDFEEPYDLADAPLTRLTLLRLGERSYGFLWSRHHLVLDGWSLPLILDELFRFYEAFAGGRELELPPPRPYRAFLRWLRSQDLAAAEEYWRERLRGFKAPVLPGPHGADERGPAGRGEQALRLSRAATERSEALARSLRLTLSTLVQGAWAVLLSRIGSGRDVVFGVVVSGRPPDLPGAESMVGLLINTLPLRVEVRAEVPAADWLTGLRRLQVELEEHAYAPLARVQAWSESGAGAPLFDTIVAFENYPLGRFTDRELAGLKVREVRSDERTSYGLALQVTPEERLRLGVEYDAGRFEPTEVRRLLKHLEVLLQALAEDPGRPVGELPLLSPEERHQTLVEWNEPRPADLGRALVPELFGRQAARRSDAAAVVFAGSEYLSYRELDRLSDRLARRLTSAGIEPEDRVALCVERSPEMVWGLLGILKAGAAFLPCDPSDPEERLRFVLADSGASAVLAERRRGEEVREVLAEMPGGPRLVCLGEHEDAHGRSRAPGVAPEQAAYVIYTSGSTGRPKGVVVSHGALAHVLAYRAAWVGERDAKLQRTALSFDVALAEVLLPLTTGGRTVLARPEDQKDGRALARLIREQRISLAAFPPSLLKPLLDDGLLAGCTGLRTVGVGGEAVPSELPDRFFTQSDAELCNRYGPTEAAIFMLEWRCRHGDSPRRLPIGRPVGRARVYLLGARMSPVAMGVPGELAIGGPCLARGYLGRPGRTADVFLPNPFGAAFGARLYRTGDLARYRTDGAVDFLGRRDHQVKVRGFRVELGEVEAVIGEHPGVREAVVLDREAEGGSGRRLVGYAVPAPGQAADASWTADLRRFLRSRLPDYMVPAAFVVLEDLPLLPSGKVDRAALGRRDLPAARAEGAELIVPRTPAEEVLAETFRRVLGLEQVGVGDDFFALGGDSILSLQVVARARQAGLEISPRLLFEHPTVAELALAAAPAGPEEARSGGAEAGAGDGPSHFPLTPMQEGMLFHCLYAPDSGIFVGQLSCRLEGELDEPAFAEAWRRLLERHEALRTAFVWEGLERPLQGAARAPQLPLTSEDWRKTPLDEQSARWEALLAAGRRLDLDRAPLLRLALVRTAERSWRFAWSYHHQLLDGWSLATLLTELSEAYAALREEKVWHGLPTRPFRDYVTWLTAYDPAPAEAFWRARLAGWSTPTRLTVDRGTPGTAGNADRMRELRLSDASVARLEARARGARLTVNTLVQGAFSVLLSRTSGDREVVFGVVLSGRSAALTGIESTVGLFINTLPLRVDAASRRLLGPWLRELAGRQAEMVEFEHVPLARVQAWSEVAGGEALFDTVLAFENYPVDEAAQRLADDLRVSEVRTVQHSNYPLNLMVLPERGPAGVEGLRLRALFDPGRFDGSAVARLLGHLKVALAALGSDSLRRVGDLPLLTRAERAELLREWNDTARPISTGASIHGLFEARAAADPGAVAVVDEAGELTYGELDRRAGRLAHGLRAMGVGPGSAVGVYLRRTAEMVAAVLGVLKAGGAYVPLEASFPRRRIAWILNRLEAPCLITEPARFSRVAGVEQELDALRHLICLGAEPVPDPLTDDVRLWRSADLERFPDDGSFSAAQAGDVAYVIFTSGSTGTPKGVVVRHRPVVNLIEWVTRRFGVGVEDRVLAVASLAFDLSVYDFFGLLAAGGSIRLASDEEAADPERLARVLLEEPITFWDSAPAALQQVVPLLPGGGRGGSRLRLVFLSGDWIPLHLPAEVRGTFPRARVIALGGATEATVWSNSFPVAEVDPSWASIPYGRPISNARYHVLDARLEPCPIGVDGDLLIGGRCLASGYAVEPALSAERFLPDPWSRRPGMRLYRTGDRARLGPDGLIEFLGRRDHQVKIRGFRIELGEVEAVLREHARVAAAVALVHASEPAGIRRLVAYVLAAGPDRAAADELRSWLRERLPDYMVPAFFVFPDALPLTANGKVDRAALQRLPVGAELRETEGRPPRTPAEAALAAVWAGVLRLERVGVDDNFFELGGDSILSIQLVSRARDAGFAITPRQLFRHPTVAALVRAGAGRGPVQAPAAEPATGAAPLTPIQRWFFERIPEEPWHWNQTLLLAPRTRLEPARVERVLEALPAHHDALRLRFVHHSEVLQRFEAPADGRSPREGALARIDLAALPAGRCRAALEAAAGRLQASLDLEAGPLARWALFHQGEDLGDRFLWVIHHLVVDGVSWRVLLGDFEAAYRQLEQGRPLSLGARTTSFKAWAEELEKLGRSLDAEREAEGWRSLPWHRVPALPADQPGGEDREHAARVYRLRLDEARTASLLRDVPKAYRTGVEDLVLASLLTAWRERTGSRFLALDLEGHGREELFEGMDLSRTVGWLTSLHPVLLELPEPEGTGPPEPDRVIREVKEQLRRQTASTHARRPGRGLTYGLLRYRRPEPVLEELPRRQIVFNYLGRLDEALPPDSLLAPAPESAGSLRSPRALRRHVLEVNAAVEGGRLNLDWRYAGDLLRHETVETLATGCLAALERLIEHCLEPGTGARTPSDFPQAGLDPAALEQVIAGFGDDAGARLRDLYPLSPAQEGMLFHTLYEPESGVYVGQLAWRIDGDLDPAAFEAAWDHAVERHEVLRTAFAWRDLERPLQGVTAAAELPFERLDWRGASRADRQMLLHRWLAADRRRGYDLSRAPLARLALARLGERSFQVLWSYHHVTLDGWSLAILLGEVLEDYQARVRGEDRPLPERRPYGDYVLWLGQQDEAAAERYWRRRLAGRKAPTPLGVDRRTAPDGGAAVRPHRGSLVRGLSPASTGRLESLARRGELTLGTLVQGAWAIVLHRYSGERDVVFGTVVSGRPPELTGVESMVGLFINTLPLRLELPADTKLRPWLRRLRDRMVELREYEHTPLVEVRAASGVPGGTPLFESIVVFENYPVDRALRQPGGELEITEVRAFEQTNYPLSLQAVPEAGEGLRLALHFDQDRFDAVAVRRLRQHLGVLLEAMSADPERRLDELPLMTRAERQQALGEWNDTRSAPREGEPPIHVLCERQALRTPDAVAVSFEPAGQLTYRELDRRSNRLARHLRVLGVGPDVSVALAVERSLELPVTVLGILKAGGAYLPLDSDYPAERLAFMLEDAGVAVTVSDGSFAEGSAGGACPTGGSAGGACPTWNAERARRRVALDAERGRIARRSAAPLRRQDGDTTAAERLAYLIYTSGSTGRPKGAMNVHRAVTNQVLWLQRTFGLGSGDRVLQKTPISFDVSVWELFWPLAAGARLVLARPGGHRDPGYLARAIARHEVTTVHFVPSVLRAFLEEAGLEECRGLRRVVASGEALTLDLERRLFERLRVELHNMYGPSEAARASSFACGADDAAPVTAIGRPIADTTLYVLDPSGRSVPAGVAGELAVGGAGVARGYRRRGALTAEKFVPSPFASVPGARLYRTGDLVRCRSDGNLEFLGRADHQVQLRGMRVEPGEIEAILISHPSVREAVVLARPAATDLDAVRLVACLVPRATEAPSGDELRRHLRARLPDYMVPSAFVTLRHIPLLPSGKTDRIALERAASKGLLSGVDAAAEGVAPRTPAEQVVAQVWCEVLGLERVGVQADFFALGGHSLLATQVVSRLRGSLGVEVPLREVFEARTVEALAREVEAARIETRFTVPPLRPAPLRPGEALPLSFAQERLWFLDRMAPGNPVFNLPAAVRLEGRLDVPLVRAALNRLVRRHAALRTTFVEKGGRPAQVIAPRLEIGVPMVDLTALPGAQREEEALRQAAIEGLRPFDLERGPLVRAVLVRAGRARHVALWTTHHTVSDGWSTGIFVRELSALCAAGAASPLPELPVRYADFALWQRSWLEGTVMRDELAYWRARLAGAPEALELPVDRPRPKSPSGHGGSRRRRVSDRLGRGLRTLARQRGATLFMVLLAAYQALLRRLSGQSDVVVGTPVAYRTRRETEGVVGFFVNNLVIRPDLPPGKARDPRFGDLLERVRQVALEAYAHQDLPFERLVRELRPERDPARTPLFQVGFVLQNAHRRKLELPGLTVTPLALERRRVQFELELEAAESDGGGDELLLVLGYRADLFDAVRIERVLRHLEVFLAGVSESPERRLSEQPLLAAAERHQLAEEWNDGWRPPGEELVLELLQRSVARAPDSLAAVADSGAGSEGGRLTYAELDRRSGALAARLVALGVGPEAVVGLFVERSLEMATALLAVLKAGGAFLPLDPASPKERRSFMLEDAGASVLLTRKRLLKDLASAPASRTRILSVDEPNAFPSAAPPRKPAAAQAAYVIYTSGSTGRPKGVVVSHGALSNLLRFRASFASPSDAKLARTSTGFDVAIAEVLVPLVAGGRAVLASCPEHDGARLARVIRRQKVTLAVFPPALLSSLLDDAALADCPSLGTVGVGGEAVPADLTARFPAQSRAALWNRYGPTETTIFMTEWRCRPEAPGNAPPIGRPAAGARVYVLDPRLRPAPPGAPGELHAAGEGLARGYLGRPARTAAAFSPHPFVPSPGARLYRTGDLARYRADGALEFLGRRDHQVKVRGFRVELGEIEAALGACPGVKAAVVVDLRGRAPEGSRLVACVTPEDDPPPSTGELRRFLRRRLPEHMIPASFHLFDALPVTASGKVDRAALGRAALGRAAIGRAAHAARGDGPEPRAAPRDPVEEILVEIFSEVLAQEHVSPDPPRLGIHDHFFELGGHSLLATRVISRVRSILGADLPLSDLFEAPTVAGLGRRVARVLGAGDAPQRLRIERVDRAAASRLPLSYAQERLWFLDRLEPGSSAYNMPVALRLAGRLEVPVLGGCLAEVVRRHETLRTRFEAPAGEPWQVVDPAVPAALPLVDLTALEEPARRAEVRRRAAFEAAASFDLLQGPLFRFTLLRLAPRDHVALFTMHHILSDAWSMEVLIHESGVLYNAARQGLPSPLPDLRVQYADYAVWQRARLSGTALERELAYWRGRLEGAPPILELPTDRPAGAVQTTRGGRAALTLPADLARGLRRLSRATETTLYMVLLAGFQALLHRYSGQTDVCVGSPVAGRTHEELQGLIGFFVNTLVLRSGPGRGAFEEHLAAVRRTCLEAYAHQEVPFERLVAELRPERSLSHTPLFQVLFVFQNRLVPFPDVPDLAFEALGTAEGREQMGMMTLTAADTGAGIGTVLDYNRDLFDPTTVRRFLGHFENLLTAAVAEPRAELERLSLVSPAERHQVRREWNDTRVSRRSHFAGVPQLVERQAARTPDAVAVILDGHRLSYAELDRRASRLARRLRGLGIGAERRVALCLERSFEMVVAVLGTLKAGGAWVPFDVAAPPERLASLIDDAGVGVVLTSERAAAVVPRTRARVVRLGAAEGPIDLPAGAGPSGSSDPPAPGGLAYLLYTSGSTGRPKGVLVTHANLLNIVRSFVDTYGLTARDRVLQQTTVTFDVSVNEILPVLTAGGALVLLPPGDELELERLVGLVEREGVTILGAAPSLLARLNETADGLGRVRLVLSGGEALAAGDVDRLRRAARVVNGYGPTEATVCATSFELRRLGTDGARKIPIGRPLENYEIVLRDRAGNVLGPGLVGELCIAGAGLARGYLDQPAWTAESFVPHSSVAGERLYRTGDLARFASDGNLEFLGRIDHQVKLRGFRIEPGEVEAALVRHPGVREAAVVLREDTPGNRRLVAYAACVEAAPEISEIRAFLEERLPAYMVPAAVVRLDALPLAATGKVDPDALPAPDVNASLVEIVGPRDDMENKLARLWEKLLDVRPISVKADFFELGGHSLLVARLVALIKKEIGIALPVAGVFQEPTIERLAALLRKETVLEFSPLVAIQPEGSRLPFFCVHALGGEVLAYHRLSDHLGPDQPFYALQAPEAMIAGRHHPPIEETAALYIEAVRKVQSSGPYLLGGYSYGCVITFEMAQQLRRCGEEVALVMLLDGMYPGRRLGRRRVGAGFIWHRVKAAAAYRPTAYPGRLTYFRAEKRKRETAWSVRRRVRRWRQLSGEAMEVFDVEGDHVECLKEPYVGPVAALLRNCIDTALEEAQTA